MTTELLPGQTPQDCPDVVARMYHAKLLDMHNCMIKKGHLGTIAAWAHMTKFQKSGLPHEHFQLVMESGSKLKSPDQGRIQRWGGRGSSPPTVGNPMEPP
jgi:hypothetical protein